MSIIKKMKEDIKKHVEEAGYIVDTLSIETSNRRDLGEYQLNDAMQLAKKYHDNPRNIAEKIVSELKKDERFTNLNIAGPGFINITLSEKYIVEVLNEMHSNLFSNIDKHSEKKVIIDYGGANVAKALHVGHLRSANIGEALKRLAKTLGYNVLGDAHLGDYGRPLGFVVLEIKKMYPDLPYFDQKYNGDYSELSLPINNADLEKIYPVASKKAKEDELYLITIETYGRNADKIEDLANDCGIFAKEFMKKYGEYFDELNEIYENSHLLKSSEGAKIIDVSKEEDNAPMPPLLFIKSNGTISYETTDLATILQRKKEFNPDEIWYVVDGRQSLRFEQIFRAVRLAHLVDDDVKLIHIPFGTMNGSDGKPFKTRDGGVMTLKSLIELVKDETIKRINPETVAEDKKEETAKDVAIAALKYADLLPFRGTDYVFEIEKFADLEGKTGPYLLYSTIRMRSLLKKAEEIKIDKIKIINGETEKNIGLLLLELDSVLSKSLETKSLNDIAEYLYNLTSLYNKFYSENKVLTEKNAELKESWLVLTSVVYSVNILLLNILGINVPEKM